MTKTNSSLPRLGIDLGGSKIALVVLSPQGEELYKTRRLTPRNDYDGTIKAITELVSDAEQKLDLTLPVGVGMPGSISPHSGLVQNANSTWLNGKPFHKDLSNSLGRTIKTANDANCLALSESVDGAAEDAYSVFGVIIGTGCGGGLVHNGKLIEGQRHIGGEWGHTPLPWIDEDEFHRLPGQTCWCGRRHCLETWISGPGLSLDHLLTSGQELSAQFIYQQARSGDATCSDSLDRHSTRLARGLAMIINIFDPEVIVLGGGLSQMSHLYDDLPALIEPYIFSDDKTVDIRAPKHGDASGVRGAARLS